MPPYLYVKQQIAGGPADNGKHIDNMSKGRNWTIEENRCLQELYPTSTKEELLEKIDRSWVSIKERARVLGLKRSNTLVVWPPEKVEKLVRLYPDHSNKEIAEALDTSESAIQHRAHCLKLKKDKEWMRKMASKSCFKKGAVPFNKGKKWDEYMSEESQRKSSRTCFKKGQTPANHKPVGWERKTVEGYWEVKVQEPDVFKAKHRILWEKHYGPIPKGINIVFVDGNKENICIENLRAETVTEKFNRCCNLHRRMPPELRKLMQLKGALKRQINKSIETNHK